MQRKALDLFEYSDEILHRMANGGVLCTVTDAAGRDNILTLGWGQIGRAYEGDPIFIIAITPLRYSWRFIEETGEFVIAVPDDSLSQAAEICGTKSGRDTDKFKAAGLTKVPSAHVAPPSIAECPPQYRMQRLYEDRAAARTLDPRPPPAAARRTAHDILRARAGGVLL